MSGSEAALADAGALTPDVLVATLAHSPIFSRCSRHELSRLLPFLRERRLEPGEALCRAGEPADDLWLVLKGTLRLQRADHSSHDVSEGLVGEEAALGIGYYLSDVVAVDRATVAALDKDITPPALRGGYTRAHVFYRSLINAFAPVPVTTAAARTSDDRLTPGVAAWKLIGWIAAVVLPLLLLQRFETSTLRWEQQQLAAVLVSMAVLWIFGVVPPYVAGLLVVLVCVTLGVVPTTVVLSGFASNGFFLGLGIFSLGAVLIESGMINRLFILLIKYCPRAPIWYDLAALMTGLTLTPVVAAAPERARVLAPLAVASARTLGYAPGSRDSTRLALSMFVGLSLFSPIFLTGGALNLMLYGSLPEQVQDAIPGLRWLVASLAALMVLLAVFFLVYLVVFRRRGTPAVPRHTIDAQLRVLGPIRATEWVAVGGVILFLGAVATASEHKIDHRLLALTIVCGYLVLGTLGKEQLNLHIDWSALILLGTIIGLIATIEYVNLNTVIAAQLLPLGEIMKVQPALFVTILAVCVVVLGLWIPLAGALIGLIAVPLAVVNGVSPWVVIFVILLMGDVCLRPSRSEVYTTYRDVVRSLAPFDDRLFLRVHGAMVVARIVALAASVVYWQRLVVL